MRLVSTMGLLALVLLAFAHCDDTPTEPTEITPAHFPVSFTVKMPDHPTEYLLVYVGVTNAADSFYQWHYTNLDHDTTWSDTVYIPARIEYRWQGTINGTFRHGRGIIGLPVDTIWVK